MSDTDCSQPPTTAIPADAGTPESRTIASDEDKALRIKQERMECGSDHEEDEIVLDKAAKRPRCADTSDAESNTVNSGEFIYTYI